MAGLKRESGASWETDVQPRCPLRLTAGPVGGLLDLPVHCPVTADAHPSEPSREAARQGGGPRRPRGRRPQGWVS